MEWNRICISLPENDDKSYSCNKNRFWLCDNDLISDQTLSENICNILLWLLPSNPNESNDKKALELVGINILGVKR